MNTILFFIIFGGLLLLFIGYAIVMLRRDKQIINEFQNLLDTWHVGGDGVQEQDMGFLESERPFVECYKSLS